MKIKWYSNLIRGDVQPLIGNIVHNNPIISNSPQFPFSPNEIVAIIGDTLIILDGAGKLLEKFCVRNSDSTGNEIISVSALLDTSSSVNSVEYSGRTLILGFESLEAERKDSLAVTYIGGWNHTENKFNYIRRLALNLRQDPIKYWDYLPNYSASIKPVYARKKYWPDYADVSYDSTEGYMIFATVNMENPRVNNNLDYWSPPPYFRGVTSFNLHNSNVNFPLPDIGDYYEYRVHIGPKVSFCQPSISRLSDDPWWGDTTNNILLPCTPTNIGTNDWINNSHLWIQTRPNKSYLFNLKLEKDGIITEGYGFRELEEEVDAWTNPSNRSRVRSYFVDLVDADKGWQEIYILSATEYNGINNSNGKSGLFLCDYYGTPLYDFWATDEEQELLPFYGSQNHYWSIATGNIDGRNNNEWLPYYPNNPGNEIIATQSTRDFAFAGSRLMILRYNSSPYLTPKASPPGTSLKNFDTICTFPIQGWVAAVNDLDGVDGKDEILLVSGSRIFVLRMNDYSSLKFRSSKYFDTIFTYKFYNETITSAAIADVDGDGKNDIIITTTAGIYILGTPLERTIEIIDLLNNNPQNYQTDWCFGDTIKIRWKNIIQGNSLVNILFKETDVNRPWWDTIHIISTNYPNSNDTATFNLVVNSFLAGKQGHIIIQSAFNPLKNSDTTGILRFHKPVITSNIGTLDTLYIGYEFTIKGTISCADKISLYYSFDSTKWIFVTNAVLDSLSDAYDITTTIPCLPIFDCLNNKVDSTIYGMIIFGKNQSVDSTVFTLTVRPTNFPITIEECDYMCPTRIITWKIPDSSIMNQMISILLSSDTGKTFLPIGRVPINAQKYLWNVPTNIFNPVILRFCGEILCFQSDTMIWNFAPKYIKTVAPNPVKIPQEAQIVYQIDEDAEVTIRIIDQSNRYVRTLIENQKRKGGVAYCEMWNVRMDDMTPVSNGMYYIMIEISNGIKEIYPLYIRN